MTVRYEYKCDSCGFAYIEQRPADEPQIYKACYICKKGDFAEVNAEVLADHAERVDGPAPVVEEIIAETPQEITE